MARRDTDMLPQEFLQLMMNVQRRQLMTRGKGSVVTVVDGCTGYLLMPHEAGPGGATDTASMLAAWTGHAHSVSQ